MDAEPTPQSDTGLKCPRCGYNLTAMTSNTCPECGERFVLTNSQGYLAKFPPSKLRQACRPIWAFGAGLVVASWFHMVPPFVGWIGFFTTVAAWLLSLIVKR